MFTTKSRTDYKLWKYFPNKNKSLRELVDENVRDVLENLTEDIIAKNYKFLTKKFNKELLKMHLKYCLIDYIYPEIIQLTLDKKFKTKDFRSDLFFKKFNFDINSLSQVFKSIVKVIIFLNLRKKKFNKKTFPIIVEYFYGLKQKNDFPDIDNFDKQKILFSFRQELKQHHLSVKNLKGKKFKYNYINLNKLNSKFLDLNKFDLEKISVKSRESLKKVLFCLVRNPKKAFLNSLILKFILEYEVNYQIFKRFNTKVLVHSLSLDKFFPPIRQALNDCNAININYLRSYYTNKINSLLAQPDEIIFSWGKYFEKNFDKKSNFNKNIFNSKPYFDKLSKDKKFIKSIKKKANGKKIVSIFDTSSHDVGIFSPHLYNSLMEYIVNYTINNENIFLIIKYKNPSTKKTFYKNELIKKLLNQKRVLEIDTPHYNTLSIYKISKIVISMNTLSVGAEALYHGCDSLNFLVKSFNQSDLKNFNKIYPFGYTNLKNFKNNFEKKLKSKINNKKLSKLKKYLFDSTNYIDSSKFIKYFIKNSKSSLSKEEIIKNYKKKYLF